MRSACCGTQPHSSCRRPALRHHAERVAAVGILLALTACAADRSAQYQPVNGDSATAYSAEAPPPRVQMEGDGMPAQSPPLRHAAAIIDDPREPWSRNYGTVTPARLGQSAPSTAAEPQREPAKVVAAVRPTRASLFQAKPIDEDAIIRRAIAEHEMRKED
jgi:hypothetical protein